MSVAGTRISIGGGTKKEGWIAVRALRQELLDRKIAIVRGGFVRRDGRIYLDADGDLNDRDLADVPVGTLRVQTEPLAAVMAVSDEEECIACGNVPDMPTTTCPNCGFREIEACPNCGTEVPRCEYESEEGGLHRCPSCRGRVRLKFNEPLWRVEERRYADPTILVERA